jgi:hypothetical protein
MQHETVTNSTSGAAAILSAWRETDVQPLDRSLAAAREYRCSDEAGADESERTELLNGIAERISNLVKYGHRDDADIYLPLLRHLAGAARPWTEQVCR